MASCCSHSRGLFIAMGTSRHIYAVVSLLLMSCPPQHDSSVPNDDVRTENNYIVSKPIKGNIICVSNSRLVVGGVVVGCIEKQEMPFDFTCSILSLFW